MFFRIIFSALCVAVASVTLFAKDEVAYSKHTAVSLIAETIGIAPGEPFKVGIYLNTETGWHTYSNPSGDTGLPTMVDWELPAGFSAGPILWPVPKTYTEGDLIAYGYEGPVLLPIEITPSRHLKYGDQVTLKGMVRWLECKDLCLPSQGTVSLTLTVKAPSQIQSNPATQALFDCYQPCEDHMIQFPLAIFSAFLGGLILNLMPCVFPVLGLKIMSFINNGRKSRSKIRLHGLVFALGVLTSFWLLSGLLLFLRSQGQALGWGFQLQSPVFVLFLIVLLFVLSLMFLGVFEMGLRLVGVGAKISARDGYSGSFLSGVLATVVATPCTAPFMGAALGFALAHEAWVAMGIFTAVGTGMALPYLILSFYPQLLQFLPKPGAWMESFKEAMAFPMLATVVWLIWVFGLQTNTWAIALLLFGLVLVGMATWMYGRWGAPLVASRIPRYIALVLTCASLAGAAVLFYNAVDNRPEKLQKSSDADLDWQPYSPELLRNLRAEGRSVFVDFTAAWCLTCQTNFHSALEDADVVRAFKDKNVATLVADWTMKDPVITEALAALGRSGVPTNVLYAPSLATPPMILPEILTEGILLRALNAE